MAEEAAAPAAAPAPAPEGGEAPAEGGEAAPAAPKKKKMLLIICGAAAVVGILVAVGVVFLMGGEEKKEEPEHTEIAPMALYEVPEFNLSLMSDDAGTQHFIKMKISLELAKPGDVGAMDKLLPRLQDDWGGFLRQMRFSDMQGSGNLQRLKEGLLRRANQSLDPIGVKAVYIRELLIQ